MDHVCDAAVVRANQTMALLPPLRKNRWDQQYTIGEQRPWFDYETCRPNADLIG